MLIYHPVARDLTAYGGPANGTVIEGVVQEVNIATGAVIFEWHSLDHIPLSKSLAPAPTDPATPWDYVHLNAIAVDTDGNLLVSARHASAVWKINRTNGNLIWTLGHGGDFTPVGFADSDWFAFQHDVRRRADGTLSVFDNGSSSIASARSFSRGLVMSLDMTHMTATITHEYIGPNMPKATSQGAFRELPGGHAMLGWGSVGQMTEYDAASKPILDLQFPAGVQSYRAVRVAWHGYPTVAPHTVFDHPGPGTVRATVSWNGATEVAKWVVLAGPDGAHLKPIASSPRTGFETTITAQTNEPVVNVRALDKNGKVLWSPPVPASTASHVGYWLARADGNVSAFGGAAPKGNAKIPPGQRVVGIADSASDGYWVARTDGGVSAEGASALGSLAQLRLKAPIVGIAATPDGHGYYLVAADGGVFTFGTARFRGSLGNLHLQAPIVGMVATPDARGYYLVAADGGVFAFGSARFSGSLGATPLVAPVVGIAMPADGHGYYLVAADGGVFTFGGAQFAGSLGAMHLRAPVVAMAAAPDGPGYYLAAKDGGVFAFGTARFAGSTSVRSAAESVVGLALH